MDGRDGGENIGRASESNEFAVFARVPGFSDQRKNCGARIWREHTSPKPICEEQICAKALLRSAILDRAQLTHAVLVSAKATGANLTASDLRFADLSMAV